MDKVREILFVPGTPASLAHNEQIPRRLNIHNDFFRPDDCLTPFCYYDK
jgi:hypothetical protein